MKLNSSSSRCERVPIINKKESIKPQNVEKPKAEMLHMHAYVR